MNQKIQKYLIVLLHLEYNQIFYVLWTVSCLYKILLKEKKDYNGIAK